MKRVYLAGASAESDRVGAWMRLIQRTRGLHLTLDWLAMIEEAGAANLGLPAHQRESAAAADWRAIQEADIVWVLAPEQPSAGAWVELGLALASGRVHVIVSGPARERCIFGALAEEFESDLDAWTAILGRRSA